MDDAAEQRIAEAPQKGVDLMNERVEPTEDDFCRICRSEGSTEQPLFHPCKCSGSVAFVHQDCLKEWLQHSQKKYCELCKTNFQFTKLYHPSMPDRIPLLVFAGKLVSHLASNILLWFRALLVCTMWLGFLPLTVKFFWQFYFNLADLVLLKEPSLNATEMAATNATLDASTSLTRWPRVNTLLIFTFQGQIISAVVAVCFVGAFLIREWVLQNAWRAVVDANAQPPADDDPPPALLEPQPLRAQEAEERVQEVDLGEAIAFRGPNTDSAPPMRQQIGDTDPQQPGPHIEPPEPVGTPNAVLAAGVPEAVPERLVAGPPGFWANAGGWFRDMFDAEDEAAAQQGIQQEEQPADMQQALALAQAMEDDDEAVEGILELIGMRGPILGLLSNGFFTLLLIALAIGAGIFIPYLLGKVTLITMADPLFYLFQAPFRLLKFCADLLVDLAAFTAGKCVVHAYRVCKVLLRVLYLDGSPAEDWWQTAASTFTAKSLARLGSRVAVLRSVGAFIYSFLPHVLSPFHLVMSLATKEWNTPVAVYTVDRLANVGAGYALLCAGGAFYLQHSKNWRQPPYGVAAQRAVHDFLREAGAVLKIVLIIGIELVVFPIFCGILLDLATLPLFANATMEKRHLFFQSFPFTSTFLHWFLGTLYMFHFAIFVSMCRSIVRPGTLYFIRDPNDPNFHPIHDVLEKPVWAQLRKILFSALVYTLLIFACFGGIIYGLTYSTSIFPVRWSSNEPVMELPIDLLLYHVLMPLAIQFFRPSSIHKALWTWHLKRSARSLRLSSFIFGTRYPDEEGVHVRRTWTATLLLKKGNPDDAKDAVDIVGPTAEDATFVRDGTLVRAPSKDSIRLSPSNPAFIPVTEDNFRVDGKAEDATFSVHDFTVVYCPPHIRLRFVAFFGCVWAFAVFCGLSCTVAPLVFGRFMFQQYLPARYRLHDIYALSFGVYVLGGVIVAAQLGIRHAGKLSETIHSARHTLMSPSRSWQVLRSFSWKAIKVVYVYGCAFLVIPSLVALIMEAFIIIPVHSYFTHDHQPIVHFVQDWTIGVLYIKLVVRLIIVDREGRWGTAMRNMVRDGYFAPDARIATRAFLAPIVGALLSALLIPFAAGVAYHHIRVPLASPDEVVRLHRYMYPVMLGVALAVAVVYGILRLSEKWVQNIRDEVYLVGEQLHNFGDNSPLVAMALDDTRPSGQESIEADRNVPA